MKFPEIPTDNLYKFMALSGIVLFIASYLPFYHVHKLRVDLARIQGEHNLIKQKAEWVSEEVERIKHGNEPLMAQMAELTEISASEITAAVNAGLTFSEVCKIKGVDIEKHEIKWDELTAKLSDQLKLLQEQQIKRIELMTNLEMLNCHLKMVVREQWLATSAAFLGSVLSFCGFTLWYRRLQAPQDMIIKQKAKDAQKQ